MGNKMGNNNSSTNTNTNINSNSNDSAPSHSPSSSSASIANGDDGSSAKEVNAIANGDDGSLAKEVNAIANGDDGSSAKEVNGIANGDGSLAKEVNARRLRIFDEKMRNVCWQKADVVPGRHPERWRKDVAGNVVCRKLTRCEGCLCYEYDHITPFSKGGETDASNCQILQSRVNRSKSNRDKVETEELRQYSCDLNFTDKELDVMEMAVYGNVIRPGLQCRCKSVAETLGLALHKSKGPEMSCELPYKNISESN